MGPEADNCALAEDEATRGAKDGVLSGAFPEAMKDPGVTCVVYAGQVKVDCADVEMAAYD